MPLLTSVHAKIMYKIYDRPKNKMHVHQRSHLLSAISNSLFKYNLESTWP